MATIVKYLKFTVHLTNKAQAAALQTQFPGGVFISPDAAAVTYAAPVQLASAPFAAPCVRSEFIIATGAQNFPTNTQQFTRKVGGWFGIPLLFGTTYNYRWYGMFAYATGSTAEINGTPKEVVAIAQRKWIIGFEAPLTGEADLASYAEGCTREASRHPDGLGYCPRDTGGTVAVQTDAGGAAQNKKTWERLYIRCRVRPTTGDQTIWSVGGPVAAIRMTVDGRLAIYKVVGGITFTQLAVSTQQLTLDTWYRVDILLEYAAVGGNLSLYVNRALAMPKVIFATGQGLSQNFNHTVSTIGGASGAGEVFEIDYDDWIGAEWPTPDSNGDFVGLDWLNGSKVQRARATGFATGNDWAGGVADYRTLNTINPAFPVPQFLSTIVSGGALRVNISTVDLTSQLGALGCVAFVVHATLNQQASVAGSAPTLGWKFDGLIDLAGITQVVNAVKQWNRMYRPSGLTVPIANLTPLELHHVKVGNVSEARCYGVSVLAELIGTFGAEDVPEDPAETVTPATFAPRKGVHMAPYPETQWARRSTPVVSPVVVHSGTYVGNAQVVELQFRAPVTWLLLKREATSGAGGEFWLSSNDGSHVGNVSLMDGVHGLTDPSFVPAGTEDSQEQRFIVRITGDNHNLAAATYQYIAFSDPGARFSLNGQFFHSSNVATFDNLLQNPNFLPECAFFQKERLSVQSYNLYFIGPGHAAGNGSPLNTTQIVGGFGSLALGKVTSLATGLNFDNDWVGYGAFRSDDQSADPNKHKVIRIGTYTGDGAASRTIGWAPSGLRPLYAIVNPVNAGSIHRTPSNTTTQSHFISGGTVAATGITAGAIDSMTVGITLNANGIVYNYFVLLGSPTAGNGGWSIDGEFIYIEPDAPADGDDDDPDDIVEPEDPEPVDPDPEPGPDDTDDCDAGEVCVTATTREVNRALLEIGNTKFLTNYCTQDTLEARTAQLLYESSVRAVLHAFPWPFATKYAALALAVTQPNNQDWLFSYRQPIDCVFERRISVARAMGVDPTPPPFELSADSSGGLIFTNEPNAVLEYTCRPVCVAFAGDALFKEALVWHLAAKLAPPLTRMADKAKFCMDEYDKSIAKAHAILRPDDPGLRVTPTWQAQDVGVGAMAANVEVANLALLKIGAKTIASLAPDQSREGASVNLLFEHELRATLRDYPWKFAKRYNDALVLVGGTATVPVNVDWQYSYRLPTDYISVRRLATEGTGRSFERYPKTFEVGGDATGDLLFTGEDAPNLEYTARIANAVLRADHLFREALAWRLASALAPALAAADPEVQEQPGRGPEHPPDNTQRVSLKPNKATMRERAQRWAFGQYLRAIEKARIADANESEREPHGEAEWIEGRN